MKPKTKKQRFRQLISVANQELNASVVELAKDYLRDFPDDSTVWSMYSVSLLNLSKIKEAKKALSKAIELYPESHGYLQWLLCRMGHIYKHSGNYRKAVEWYNKAHEKNPDEASF